MAGRWPARSTASSRAPPRAMPARAASSTRGEAASSFIHRLRLREEARQDVIDHHVVLLLEAGVRNAGHHGELLVRVRQLFEELQQVIHRGDALVRAAHYERT